MTRKGFIHSKTKQNISLYKDGFGIKLPTKVDMSFKKEAEPLKVYSHKVHY